MELNWSTIRIAARQHRKLLVGVSVAIIALLFIFNAPGGIELSSNQPDVNLLLDNNQLIKQNSLMLVGHGEYVVSATKYGYYPINYPITIKPFSYQKLSTPMTPQSLVSDLKSTSRISIDGTHYASYCDGFKTSVCISVSSDGFTAARTALDHKYPYDPSPLLVFRRDPSTNDVIVSDSSRFTIKLSSSQSSRRPVLVIIGHAADVTDQEVLASVTPLLKSSVFTYYIQYMSSSLSSHNTVPNESIVYWNEYGE